MTTTRRDEMREKEGRDQSKGTRERDEETLGSVTRLELSNGNHKSVIASLSKAKYNYRLLREWSSMLARARAHRLFVSSIAEELRLLRTYSEKPQSPSTRSSDVIIGNKMRSPGRDTFLRSFLYFLIKIVEDIRGRQLMRGREMHWIFFRPATRCDLKRHTGFALFVLVFSCSEIR